MGSGNKKKQLKTAICSVIIFLLLVSSLGCSRLYFKRIPLLEPAISLKNLSSLTCQETWYEIVFNGKKIGFSHIKINPVEKNPKLFKINSSVFFSINFLGIRNEVNFRGIDYVKPDLTLVSFENELIIDKKKLLIKGEVKKDSLFTRLESDHILEQQSLEINEPLYPASGVNLYPPLKGMKTGNSYQYQIYDPHSQSLKKVKQKVLSYETSEFFDEPAFRVKTSITSLNATSWINDKGETIFEMSRGGRLIIAKEAENTAKQFIYKKSFKKNDDFLDFCLIKTKRTIPHPRDIKFLEVEITGLADYGLIISDQRQKIEINEEKNPPIASFRIEAAPKIKYEAIRIPLPPEKFNKYLTPSRRIQSKHPEIVSRAKTIIKGEKQPLPAVKDLVSWVSREIKSGMVDSVSALEVLRSKEGECQAHALLYTALSRAVGIPTRVVSGLVYLENMGFLYHSWAESFTGCWIAVDPTFGQVPADASHIKLVEGENLEDLSPLVDVIGYLKAEVINFK